MVKYDDDDDKPAAPIFANANVGQGSRDILGLRIRILAEAYQRLFSLIRECPHEISGFGKAVEDEPGFLITDIAVLHQEAGAVHTEIEPEDAEKFLLGLLEKNEDPSRWRVWWHSHVNMAAVFSSIDTDTMNKLFPEREHVPWAISIVGNKRGEFSVRFDIYRTDKTRRMALVNRPLEIVFGETESVLAEASEAVKTYVRKPKPLLTYRSGGKKQKGWMGKLASMLADDDEADRYSSKYSAGGGMLFRPTDSTTKSMKIEDADLEVWQRVDFETKRAIVGAWQDEVERLVKVYKLDPNRIYDAAATACGSTVSYLRNTVDIGNPTKRAFGTDGKHVYSLLSAARKFAKVHAEAEEKETGAAAAPADGEAQDREAPELTLDDFRKMKRQEQEKLVYAWMLELATFVKERDISVREIAALADLPEDLLQRHFDRFSSKDGEWKPKHQFGSTLYPAVVAARLIDEERDKEAAPATEAAGNESGEAGKASADAPPAVSATVAEGKPAENSQPAAPEGFAGTNGNSPPANERPLDELTLAEYNELSDEQKPAVLHAWFARFAQIWETCIITEKVDVADTFGAQVGLLHDAVNHFKESGQLTSAAEPRTIYSALQAVLNVRSLRLRLDNGKDAGKEVRK